MEFCSKLQSIRREGSCACAHSDLAMDTLSFPIFNNLSLDTTPHNKWSKPEQLWLCMDPYGIVYPFPINIAISCDIPWSHGIPWPPHDTPCLLNSTTLNWAMCRFLCPWEKMDAESRAALPGALRESLEKEGATLTGHPPWQWSQKGWATSWRTCTTVYRIPYCTVWQFEAGTWSDLKSGQARP